MEDADAPGPPVGEEADGDPRLLLRRRHRGERVIALGRQDERAGHVHHARLGRDGAERLGDVAPRRPHDGVDAVGADQLDRGGDALGRVRLVVLDEDLERPAVDAAALVDLVDREEKPIAARRAHVGEVAAEGVQVADPPGVVGGAGAGQREEEERRERAEGREQGLHPGRAHRTRPSGAVKRSRCRRGYSPGGRTPTAAHAGAARSRRRTWSRATTGRWSEARRASRLRWAWNASPSSSASQ